MEAVPLPSIDNSTAHFSTRCQALKESLVLDNGPKIQWDCSYEQSSLQSPVIDKDCFIKMPLNVERINFRCFTVRKKQGLRNGKDKKKATTMGLLAGLNLNEEITNLPQPESDYWTIPASRLIELDESITIKSLQEDKIEDILMMNIVEYEDKQLVDKLRSLLAAGAQPGFIRNPTRNARLEIITTCVSMLERGAELRLVEAYLMHKKDWPLLHSIVPMFQSQIIVNDDQLCNSPFVRRVFNKLGNERTGRVNQIERPFMGSVSVVLDCETAAFVKECPNQEWTRKTCAWIASTGLSRFKRYYFVIATNGEDETEISGPAEPQHKKIGDFSASIDLACAVGRLCENNIGLFVSTHIVGNSTQAALLLRHLMINRCKNAHSQVPMHFNTAPLHQYQEWIHDTKHEALLRSMPHINELKSFLAIRGEFSWFPNSQSMQQCPEGFSPLRWSLQHLL